MLRKLDIDNDIRSWLPAFKDVRSGKSASCPKCGNKTTDTVIEDLGDKIGYVLITCPACGKSGYFSRVDFSNWNQDKTTY